MKISHGLEYAALLGLSKFVQALSPKTADKVAVKLGKFAFKWFGSRKQIAEDNLQKAFYGAKNDEEIQSILQDVFINLGRSAVEIARLPVTPSDKLLEIVRESEGIEHLQQAMSQKKGLLMVTGHFGAWEMLAAYTAALGYKTSFLVGRQHNPLNHRLINSFRKRENADIISATIEARRVLKSLKNNNVVTLAVDQHSATGPVTVEFFGRKAAAPKGPAAFAVKTGCPSIVGVLIREKYNHHKAVFSEPIYPPHTGDKDKDISLLTQTYTTMLERQIREYPHLWMWTHRRWKIDNSKPVETS